MKREGCPRRNKLFLVFAPTLSSYVSCTVMSSAACSPRATHTTVSCDGRRASVLSTAHVHPAGTHKLFGGNTFAFGVKRLRLHGSVAPAKVPW